MSVGARRQEDHAVVSRDPTRWPDRLAGGAADPPPLPAVQPPLDPYSWEARALEPFLEDYRRLMTSLRLERGTPPVPTIAFVGPVTGAGASTVASCFALTLSRHRNLRVLLIDANLRAPVLGRLFEVDAGTGLAELAGGRCGFPEATQRTRDPQVDVIPAGTLRASPLQLLASDRMRDVLTEAAAAYDCVLVDGAPVLANAESPILAAQASGTVLVVRADATRWEVVHKAHERLTAARSRVLGVVLTGRRHMIPPFVYRRL